MTSVCTGYFVIGLEFCVSSCLVFLWVVLFPYSLLLLPHLAVFRTHGKVKLNASISS